VNEKGKRKPKGLVRLVGSSLPYHAEIPPSQGKPAPTGAFDPKPAPAPPPQPDVRCPHNMPVDYEDSYFPGWNALGKNFSFRVDRYVNNDEHWVATQPGPGLHLAGCVVAGDCPVCCPYCPHEIEKSKGKRRMIPLADRTDPEFGFRLDRYCVICNESMMKTASHYNAWLAYRGLRVMAGDPPGMFVTGGGSAAMEEKDGRKNHPARIAQPKAPNGSSSGTYSDETQQTDELGFVHGSFQEGDGERSRAVGDATPAETFAAMAPDDVSTTDDDHLEPVVEHKKKKQLVVAICTPQQHQSLTSEFRLKRKLKKNEFVLCSICHREVYAA
jgi:hypothetical protein